MPIHKQLQVSRVTTAASMIDKVTFGLGINEPMKIGDDQTVHGICLTAGFLMAAFVIAKTGPTGDVFIDIQRSDRYSMGGVWDSVFPSGAPLRIPTGCTTRRSQFTFATMPFEVRVGDWWRIDVKPGSAEDAQDVYVVLVWKVSSIDQSIADILALPPF